MFKIIAKAFSVFPKAIPDKELENGQ